MTVTATPTVGSSVRKQNGARFLTGRGSYLDDLVVPGVLYAAVLRSPYAHARIRSIDASAALAAAGVVAVATGAEALRLTDPIPHWSDPGDGGGRTAAVHCLATDKVRFAGQGVAAVVARTRQDAEAALAAIVVDYEVLPHVLAAEAALAPGAPLLYEEWGDNLLFAGRFAHGDVDGALAAAAHRVDGELRLQRYTSAPIETRGYVADWDRADGRLTVHGTFQNPHLVRHVLSRAVRLPENRVRIVAPAMGGAFGLKMHGHPEETLVCLLSLLAGAPVKWVESRSEMLLIGGREQTHRFSAAFDGDGVIGALRVDLVANVGPLQPLSSWDMAVITALTFPCAYRVAACDIGYRIVATNKGPWNGARGYGKEAATVVMERVVDLVAARVGCDPAEVRRRNFIRPDEFPFRTTAGLVVDSGDYGAVLDKALVAGGYEEARVRQARLRADGRLIGVGLAFELTPEGADLPGTLSGGYDTVTVRVDPSGHVTVLTGVTTPGGGNDTAIAQIVADRLGVEPAVIDVVQGDTAICPFGYGNYSGRSTLVGGSAAALAAGDVRDKLALVAAELLEADPATLLFAGGRIHSGDLSLTIAETSYALHTAAFTVARGVEPPLEATRSYKPGNIDHTPDESGRTNPYPTYSNGAYLAVVEVERETGKVTVERLAAVHDCGTMINPTLVEGQTCGGVAMGVGGALFEEQLYDAAGRLLTDRFKTYLMPRSTDLPTIALDHHVTPSPYTLLGTKGAGEASVGGGLAAVTNAVADALAPLGVEITELPLTAPRLLRLIAAAGHA